MGILFRFHVIVSNWYCLGRIRKNFDSNDDVIFCRFMLFDPLAVVSHLISIFQSRVRARLCDSPILFIFLSFFSLLCKPQDFFIDHSRGLYRTHANTTSHFTMITIKGLGFLLLLIFFLFFDGWQRPFETSSSSLQ